MNDTRDDAVVTALMSAPVDTNVLNRLHRRLERGAERAGLVDEWVQGPVPIRAAKVRGHEMSVRTVCLGRHALRAAGHDAATVSSYVPGTALVNFYDASARLGMHQDKDEQSLAPVVSLSIGDGCTFRCGTPRTAASPIPTSCWPPATSLSSAEHRGRLPGEGHLGGHGPGWHGERGLLAAGQPADHLVSARVDVNRGRGSDGAGK